MAIFWLLRSKPESGHHRLFFLKTQFVSSNTSISGKAIMISGMKESCQLFWQLMNCSSNFSSEIITQLPVPASQIGICSCFLWFMRVNEECLGFRFLVRPKKAVWRLHCHLEEIVTDIFQYSLNSVTLYGPFQRLIVKLIGRFINNENNH